MEAKLGSLLGVSKSESRMRPALEHKARGGKVVGVLCSYVPEELIHAAGVMPVRISGTTSDDTSLANFYRPRSSCPYGDHVLQSLLSGELGNLDAVIATNWDQDLARMADVWQFVGRKPPIYVMHVPHDLTETCHRQFLKEVERLREYVEELSGLRITPSSLGHSIGLYDRTRRQLRSMYELRRKAFPPLSGAEALAMVLAWSLMEKEDFASQFDSLLPYIAQRPCPLPTVRPRLLVSSDRLDDPGYLELVEGTGCLVAMDDLDTGSRQIWQEVGKEAGSLDEMLEALARRYLAQPASPRMMNWRDQAAQIADWARAFDVGGVVELQLVHSRPREMRARFLKDALSAVSIPVISFRRDYHVAGQEQLRTRVGAFVETLLNEESPANGRGGSD